MFVSLCESEIGFNGYVTDFLTNLAAAIFEHQGLSPVVDYDHLKEEKSWKGEFFGRKIKPTLLRDSSPLTRAGNRYRFIHDSLFDYLRSRAFSDPCESDDNDSDSSDDGSDDSDSDSDNSGSDGDYSFDSSGHDIDPDGKQDDDPRSSKGELHDVEELFSKYTSADNVGGTTVSNNGSTGGNGGFGGQGDSEHLNSESMEKEGGSSDKGQDSNDSNQDSSHDGGSAGRGYGGSSGGRKDDSGAGKDGSNGDKGTSRRGKDDPRRKKKGRSKNSGQSSSRDPLSRQNIFNDPAVLEFLVDRTHADPRFKDRMLSTIMKSKTSANPNLAAANATVILFMSGERFHDIDFADVRVPSDYMSEMLDPSPIPSDFLTGVELLEKLVTLETSLATRKATVCMHITPTNRPISPNLMDNEKTTLNVSQHLSPSIAVDTSGFKELQLDCSTKTSSSLDLKR
jgi:hypothetical protein